MALVCFLSFGPYKVRHLTAFVHGLRHTIRATTYSPKMKKVCAFQVDSCFSFSVPYPCLAHMLTDQRQKYFGRNQQLLDPPHALDI